MVETITARVRVRASGERPDGTILHGILAWLLEIAAIERGYRSRYWGTSEDWGVLGGGILFEYGDTLINGDQISIPLDGPPRDPDYERARRLVVATGARIKPDVRPRYIRTGSRDWIGMPDESWCKGGRSQWWPVLFHELIHWAVYGVDRLGVQCEYSHGELIAEMGAALLADRFGITMRGDLGLHALHVKDWIADARADPEYLLTACQAASIAAMYLLTLGGQDTCGRPDARPTRSRRLRE